ncbi:hypothetical protein JCM15519_14840 [Fundidesulfovibrio butyratiphilus]
MKRAILYILCLLAFIEVSSRIFWRMLDRTWGFVVPQQIGCFDPDLGWSLKPGATAWSKTTGVDVEYAINDQGYRGPVVTPEKPEGTFRIVVVGDSHAFGFGLRERFTLPVLLQGYFKNVEVVNLAVSGYGIDQMLLRVRRDGYKLHPDLVICYVPHFADFRHMTDSIWRLGKPRFVEENGKLELKNSPVTNNSPLFMALVAADRFAATWCRTYEILRNTVYWMAIPKAKPGEVGPPLDPKFWADTVGLGLDIARLFDRESQEHGAKFILFTRVGQMFVDAFKQGGPPCLYVGTPLVNDEMVLAHDPFRHPNEAASGVLAWELTKFLKEKDFVPKQYWGVPMVQ